MLSRHSWDAIQIENLNFVLSAHCHKTIQTQASNPKLSMMNRRQFVGMAAGASLAGCSVPDEMAVAYAGPQVTHVEVRKSDRRMYLWSHGDVIRVYEIDLGFAPVGPKRFEGDGKTPEGLYYINRRNPESRFYLSLGISYPNARDVANARLNGRDPGGDIFIHGRTGATLAGLKPDWTAGCIALENAEMREVYWMVRVGTPITIRA